MSSRNESLEKLIAAHPDDADNYLVYADWLSAQGDPRGELITIQHKLSVMKELDRKGVPGGTLEQREKALLAQHERFLPGVPPAMVAVKWRWGFLESVHFNNGEDWMKDDVDAVGMAQRVFAAPVALALRVLDIGVMRWDHSEQDVPAILKAAGESQVGPRLRGIHVGNFGDDDVDNGMYNPGQLDTFAGRFPALESLVIHGSEFSLGSFELPALKKLSIETCSFRKEDLARLVDAKWPRLEHLEIWFGSDNRGASCGASDLTPILDGSVFPAVKHLGLRNAEFADDLPAALAGSKLLQGLRTLDLSKGTMSSVGARALLDARSAFQHLASLSVDDNFLDDDVLEELRTIGPTVVSEEQKDDDLSIEGEVHRYVSMAE
jgi:uncharacterized protein (TIGR02996 family)